MCGKQIGHILQNDAQLDQNILCCSRVLSILTLNACYKDMVERLSEYILEQSVLIRAVKIIFALKWAPSSFYL